LRGHTSIRRSEREDERLLALSLLGVRFTGAGLAMPLPGGVPGGVCGALAAAMWRSSKLSS